MIQRKLQGQRNLGKNLGCLEMERELPPVCIPSYKRPELLVEKTLGFLAREGYPVHLIHVYVASEEQKELYESIVPWYMVGSIRVGVLGLSNQRNFIRDSWPEGQILLQMDDDVRGVKTLDGEDFLGLVRRGLQALQVTGLWGILPTDDGRRLKADSTHHLTHIVGAFFMARNHKDICMTTNDVEDYERSILYFLKYGTVCRYRGAGVATEFWAGDGGLQGPERESRRATELERLVATYPTACSKIQKPKMIDIRLNWRFVPSSLHIAPLPSVAPSPCSGSSRPGQSHAAGQTSCNGWEELLDSLASAK